jgi:hypothetical protein
MSAGTSFVPLAYGIDDLTLGFDMEGSRAIERLSAMPGTQTRRGKMLGEVVSWGRWSHLLGRSVCFWKSDTKRLYVQAKLAPEGELCAPSAVRAETDALLERLAVVGLVSYSPRWVTRVDVAIDAKCDPADGKLLLDALEATRLPHGWRTTSSGVPRSTVYFRARRTEKVYARAYCRNRKTNTGEPFARIRLEAEQRYGPMECFLSRVIDEPEFVRHIWMGRFGGLTGTVTRISREVQVLVIAEKVQTGQLDYKAGERMSMFLDLERLGLARGYYPPSVYAARRREAARLGLSTNEAGMEELVVDVNELLAAYLRAADGDR